MRQKRDAGYMKIKTSKQPMEGERKHKHGKLKVPVSQRKKKVKRQRGGKGMKAT